jgi:hypothetical protein
MTSVKPSAAQYVCMGQQMAQGKVDRKQNDWNLLIIFVLRMLDWKLIIHQP